MTLNQGGDSVDSTLCAQSVSVAVESSSLFHYHDISLLTCVLSRS